MEFAINNTNEKKNPYKIIRRSQLLEELLEPWRDTLGCHFDAYKNHSLRTINYCNFMLSPDEETMQHLVITAAYHQLGLWLKATKDYPSISAETLLLNSDKIGFDPVPDRVLDAILKHHTLTQDFAEHDSFACCFWKAFRIEVSMGYSDQGLPEDFIQKVRECIPVDGYNKIATEKLLFSFAKRISKYRF